MPDSAQSLSDSAHKSSQHIAESSPTSARWLVGATVLAFFLLTTQLVAGGDSDIDVSPGEDARTASGPNGESVVVFESDDLNESGVFAARFDSSGQAVGAELAVNLTTVGDQDEPDVEVLPNGEFVVVWRADAAAKSSTIESRLFASDGTPLAGEVQVNVTGLENESPRLAADGQGQFSVVWADAGDVMHRRFTSAGAALGKELTVTDSGMAESPTLAVLPNGEQLVVWEDGDDVLGRRLDLAGALSGPVFFVSPMTLGERSEPDAAPSGDGAFLVTYRSEGEDGSGAGVFVRRVEDVAVGAEFQINTYTTGDQIQPSLDLDESGQILLTWQSEAGNDGESAGIFGRFLRPTGRPVCPDAAINTQTALAQRSPSVAGGSGQFIVSWQTEAAMPLPGQVANVQARLITAPLFADGFESGDLTSWSTIQP